MATQDLLNSTDLSNPPLAVYFSLKISSIDKVVFYTKQRIREMIEVDLGVNMNNFNPYITEVILEAVPYYLENWSGWNQLRKYDYDAKVEFQNFIKDMRSKVNDLKSYEKYYLNKFNEEKRKHMNLGNVYELPKEIESKLRKTGDFFFQTPGLKTKLPYALQFKGSIEQLHGLTLETTQGEDIQLTIHSIPGLHKNFMTPRQILNLPFVSVAFELPGFITIKRMNPFKIERFLCKKSDNWKFPIINNNGVEIAKAVKAGNKVPVVLTLEFFNTYVKSLMEAITSYSQMLNLNMCQDIVAIVTEFLEDIDQSNVLGNTICEGRQITYTKNGNKYYNDSCKNIEMAGPGDVILRTIMIPMVQYCLYDITLKKSEPNDQDKDDDYSSYFDFSNLINPVKYNYTKRYSALTEEQLSFVKQLNNSVVYRCLICNNSFQSMAMLGVHVKLSHPVNDKYVCTKCGETYVSNELLENCWLHKCVIKYR